MKLSEEHPQATGRVCPSALPVMHMTEAPLAFTIYYVPGPFVRRCQATGLGP